MLLLQFSVLKLLRVTLYIVILVPPWTDPTFLCWFCSDIKEYTYSVFEHTKLNIILLSSSRQKYYSSKNVKNFQLIRRTITPAAAISNLDHESF